MKVLREKKIYLFPVLLIILQFGLSVLRVGYYVSKAAVSDRKLLYLSDEKKRIEYYGDEYIFFEEIKKMSPNVYFLLANEGKAYFLGRYLIYPKKIYLFGSSKKNEDYILLFKKKDKEKMLIECGYRVIKIVRNQQQQEIGEIFKKK